jgi:GNAT superfamily N-acetyltransferase
MCAVLGTMGALRLTLRCADARDYPAIIGLIEAARRWLRTKNTDQWLQPWPSEEDRHHRIRAALQEGKTWVAWDGNALVATITADVSDSGVWPEKMLAEPAVYISRLIVSRRYAGRGVGAWLLDWAGLRARSQYGAQWMRVDVWTTNQALHEYYEQQGFAAWGYCETIPDYPSAKLFQKPTAGITLPATPLFEEVTSGEVASG